MRTWRDAYYRIRSWLVHSLLHIGNNQIRLGKGFRLTNSIINYRGGVLTIGNGFFMNRNGSINVHYKIEIGKNCLIGENVHIYDHNHLFKEKNRAIAAQGFKNKSVKIGDYCWIGTGVTILGGVTIGDNVIIGANCLIYHDIPSNTVVKNKQDLLIEKRK